MSGSYKVGQTTRSNVDRVDNVIDVRSDKFHLRYKSDIKSGLFTILYALTFYRIVECLLVGS